MSSNNKQLLDIIEKVFNEVKEIKKMIALHNIDLNIIKENSNLTHFKVSNLSSKVDLDISTLNITSTETVVKNNTSNSTGSIKKKQNIMAYAKTKFKDDPDMIYKIVGKEAIEELFEKHADELKAKSKKKETLETFKAALVYKELIKENSDNLAKLRSIKEDEESGNVVSAPEINENIIIKKDKGKSIVRDDGDDEDDIEESEIETIPDSISEPETVLSSSDDEDDY
jgi:hypothetical protein